MSRDWIGVYSRIVRLPKFRKLPDAAQLTLVYTWLLAGDTEPEATWPSLETLGDVLVLTGRSADALVELVERRWLDVAEDGSVSVHDWDAHQYAATKAGKARWELHYMRKWRLAKKEAAAEAAPDLRNGRVDPVVAEGAFARDEPDPTVHQRIGQDLTGPDSLILTGVNNASPRVNNKSTCPGCGDLLDDHDENVTMHSKGQLWHRACPDLTAVSA